MKDFLEIVKKTDLFAGLPDVVLEEEILPHRQLQTYRKGQFLIVPQQQMSKFGVILSGKVHILHLFPEGNYSLMSALGPGEILGADLICTKSQRSPYHALATGEARVMFFPAELLTAPGYIREPWRQDVVQQLLLLISQENMKKEYRLAILSQKGLRERIVTYLTMQSARRQQSTFSISFSREELAAYLCVNRSALSHELSRMQQEGLITFHKNIFTLHNFF